MPLRIKFPLRFSLRSLLLASVLTGSALTLHWHWAPWAVERTLNAASESANTVAFSQDGNSVAVGLEDGTIRVHQLGWSGGVVTFHAPPTPFRLAFSTDGKLLAACCNDNTAHVWDLVTGKARFDFKHTDAINSICFSRDGTKLVASSCDCCAHIWNIDDGRELSSYRFESPITDAVFSPDDRSVAVYDTNKTVVWSMAENKSVPDSDNYESVYSNCRWRITRSPLPRLEDVFTHTQSAPLNGYSVLKEGRGYNPLACANGRCLGAIDSDGNVWLWDTATGDRDLVLSGTKIETTPGYSVPNWQDLSLSPDPHRFAVIDHRGLASVYAYRRPNTPWGIILLPELWLTVLAGVALLWSVWRDRRVLLRRA